MPGEDNRFTEQGSAFGPSDIESITECCKIGERNVIFRTGEGIGESGAVNVKSYLIPMAELADFLEFGERI